MQQQMLDTRRKGRGHMCPQGILHSAGREHQSWLGLELWDGAPLCSVPQAKSAYKRLPSSRYAKWWRDAVETRSALLWPAE